MNLPNFKTYHNKNGIMDVVAINFKSHRVKCHYDHDYDGYQTGTYEVNNRACFDGSKRKVALLKEVSKSELELCGRYFEEVFI